MRSLAAIKASGQPFLPRKDFHALVRRHPMVFADAFRLFHVMVPFAGAAVKVMAQLTEEGCAPARAPTPPLPHGPAS